MSKISLMLVLDFAGILLHDAFAIKRKSHGRRHLLIKRSPTEPSYSPDTTNYSPDSNNYSPDTTNYSPDPNNYSPDSNNYSPDNSYGGDGRPNILGDNIGTAAGQPENDPQLCLQCPSNSLGILGQLRTFLGSGEGFFTLLNSKIDEYTPYGVYIFSTIRALNNFLTGCNNLNGIVPTYDD